MTRSRGVHIYQVKERINLVYMYSPTPCRDGEESGTSRVVQGLRLCSFKSGGKGLTSAQRTKIPHTM